MYLFIFIVKGKPYLKEKISKNFDVPIKELTFNKSALNYIREVKNRHKCITMPFEATYKSIDSKENQKINQGIQNVSQTK